MPHPWRHWKSGWTERWATCSSCWCTCPLQGSWTWWSLGSFPTQIILWCTLGSCCSIAYWESWLCGTSAKWKYKPTQNKTCACRSAVRHYWWTHCVVQMWLCQQHQLQSNVQRMAYGKLCTGNSGMYLMSQCGHLDVMGWERKQHFSTERKRRSGWVIYFLLHCSVYGALSIHAYPHIHLCQISFFTVLFQRINFLQ